MFEIALYGAFNMEWWMALCIFVGIALCFVEMFLPGFGIPGASGIIFILIGIVAGAATVGEAVILIVFVAAILALGLFVILPLMSHLKSPLFLDTEMTKEKGYVSSEVRSAYMGREGMAKTALRPAGIGEFNGVKQDVVTQGEFIEQGTAIIVMKVDGNRIVVRAK